MGRKPITDGSKKIRFDAYVTEQELQILGKEIIAKEFRKMIDKLISNIQKGKHPAQICLLDSIKDIEQNG